MQLYANAFGDGDAFIATRLPLLRRGLALQGWQQYSPEQEFNAPLQGAFWQAFVPWGSPVYRPPTKANGGKQVPGFGTGWPPDGSSREYIWVCSSGKIGAFLLKLHSLTPDGDARFVSMAHDAGTFLLRLQQPDGDL
eukprot:COSAG04_NODE_12077_length_672_cov_0.869110_1_plen_136_part_10